VRFRVAAAGGEKYQWNDNAGDLCHRGFKVTALPGSTSGVASSI
jgi:hypothetical protein